MPRGAINALLELPPLPKWLICSEPLVSRFEFVVLKPEFKEISPVKREESNALAEAIEIGNSANTESNVLFIGRSHQHKLSLSYSNNSLS
ncbi:hypothetical protein THOB06_30214 [Vibrio rotiferianus]|nr:hypothetical protein THOG10_30214 [Vibrio rotiferianus]CAH1583389.1 hypothetical protein THOB06_30214 [Vibrio rotiferianus]